MSKGDSRNKKEARRERLLKALRVVAGLACLLTLVKYGVWKAMEVSSSADFCTYYNAALNVSAGKSPYTFQIEPTVYCYPLLLAIALVPITRIKFATANFLWFLGNWIALLLFVVIILLWAKRLMGNKGEPARREKKERAMLAIFFVIGYIPLLYTFCSGQIDLWVSVIMFGGLYYARFERRWIAGTLVAAAIILKIAPILWLPGLIFLLKRRGILAVIISAIIYELFIGLMGWWKWEWFLASEILPRWQFNTMLPSFSLFHIIHHWGVHLGFAEETVTALGLRVFWVGRITALLVYALILWWGWKRRLSPMASAGLGILVSYYIMAIMEVNHLIWIVIPVSLALLEQGGRLKTAEIGTLIMAWMLGAICFESNQVLGLWWGFQLGFVIPVVVAILYVRPSRFEALINSGEHNPSPCQ